MPKYIHTKTSTTLHYIIIHFGSSLFIIAWIFVAWPGAAGEPSEILPFGIPIELHQGRNKNFCHNRKSRAQSIERFKAPNVTHRLVSLKAYASPRNPWKRQVNPTKIIGPGKLDAMKDQFKKLRGEKTSEICRYNKWQVTGYLKPHTYIWTCSVKLAYEGESTHSYCF